MGAVLISLHLGVLEMPYGNHPETTGEVAEWLENRYHVMELFAEDVGSETIEKAFEESAQAAIEDLFSGARVEDVNLTLDATEMIQTEFRKFIDEKKLDFVVPGVPTKASLEGVNHRFKHSHAKGNPVRPSFKDTGTYSAAFRAWTE